MKKNRLVIFDALKVFSTLLVINLHYEMIVLVKPLSVLSYLGWYAVPLFIMISFYFNSKYFFAMALI